MQNLNIQGMVFDLDGTLVDSHALTFDAFRAGFKPYQDTNYLDAQLLSYFGPKELHIFEKYIGGQRGKEVAPNAFDLFYHHFEKNMHQAPLFKGIKDLLIRLKKEGITLGIFTARSRATTNLLLKFHNLESYFNVIVTGCDVTQPKPSGEGLLSATEGLQLMPHQVVHVGDSGTDILAAAQAQIRSIGVLWDKHANGQKLHALGAHHLAKTPEDLLTWFFANR